MPLREFALVVEPGVYEAEHPSDLSGPDASGLPDDENALVFQSAVPVIDLGFQPPSRDILVK